jgi:hypothetical protein
MSGPSPAGQVPGSPGPVPTSGTHPGDPPPNVPEPDYSGIWLADDGGMYFVRQIDTLLWWVGANRGELCPGLQFCNVYRASVAGRDISGDWSDVPRGATSGSGTLTLRFGDDNLLHKAADTGGFGASSWELITPVWPSPWPLVSVADAFPQTLKNVVGNLELSDKQTLADNLQPLKDPVTVFALIGADLDSHPANAPVSVTHPGSGSPGQGFSYSDFICLNSPSPSLGLGGQNDCDATFKMLGDVSQIDQRQPQFFDGIDAAKKDVVHAKLGGEADATGFEAEMIMFGRSADCGDDNADGYPALFPGWAERPDGSVLFNGRPMSITDFVSEISFRSPVRVTGVLAFDKGHPPDKLEIHPVYSVDKIMGTFSDLSGTWTDDVGNTYYLRHEPSGETVWYVGLSPPGNTAFAQVFRGTFHPVPVIKDSAVPEGIGSGPVTPPQNVLTGDVVAIDLGWGTAPPFEVSGTRLGDTGQVTFELGNGDLLGGTIPALSAGSFRLMKLSDA